MIEIKAAKQNLWYLSSRRIWALGHILTIVFFIITNFIIFDRHFISAQKEGSEYISRLRSEALFIRDILDGFASHLAISDDENCNSKSYALAAIRNHPTLRALSRNAIVLDENRAWFESSRRNFNPEFRITERAPNGAIIRARRRDRYAVVTCIEPLENNLEALGFDLLSEPDRAKTIERALASDQVETTSRIDLVQESATSGGVLLIKSIISTSDKKIIGTASAVMSFKTFFELASLSLPRDWSGALYESDKNRESLLYEISRGQNEIAGVQIAKNIMTFSDRAWLLRMELPLSILLKKTLAEPWSWIWLIVGIFGTWSSAKLYTQARLLREANRDIQVAAEIKLASGKKVAAASERQKILADLHDSIGANLIGLLALVGQGAFNIDKLKTMITETLTELRLLVDTTQGENQDTGLLLAGVRHRMANAIEQAGIQLHWQVDDIPRVSGLSERDQFAFKLILLEAISNALHHARAKNLIIKTIFDQQMAAAIVIVQDDGCGFDIDEIVPHGLNNMRKRANGMSIGATLSIQSKPGSGTAVRLELPVKCHGAGENTMGTARA